MADPRMEWMDALVGVIVGVIATVLSLTRWINPRLIRIDEQHRLLRVECDRKVEEVHARVTPLAQHVAALEAHQERDRDRLQSIDGKLDRIERYLLDMKNGRTL